MTLTSIRSGDIVRCDVKGRIFLAFVVARVRGMLVLDPITRGGRREVTARQVVEHWRKSKARS